MKIRNLTDKTFLLYAAQNYDNPECCGMDEFREDLNRIKYVKRILRKYHKTQDIDSKSIRLALNHTILLLNVFGTEATPRLLFYKLDDYLYPYIKPILIYLNILPRTVNGINTIDVNLDQKIVNLLREI